MEFEDFYLKNGIRVVLMPRPGVVSHISLTILAGSRFEEEGEEGLAHFIEHGLFKGTQKRKAFHVLNRLDSVGGELNAYTTKEEISIQASFLNEYMERALEILSDISFNSTFSPKEMEKEKEIVLDEILSYKDSPVESIFDDFEEKIFGQHPLAHPILGYEKTVKSFDQNHIQDYISKNFVAEGVSLVVIGEYKKKLLQKWLEKHFAELPLSKRINEPSSVSWEYQPFTEILPRSQFQTHTILGAPAFGIHDPDRVTVALLNNWLGGPTLNSRLSLNVREKYGYTYNIESNYMPFLDHGIMNIYFGTDKKHTKKTMKAVMRELHQLRTKKMGSNQLNMAKVQLKGNMALTQESGMALASTLGKNALTDKKIETIEEIHKKIDAITAEDILRVSEIIFNPERMSTLTFEQKESD